MLTFPIDKCKISDTFFCLVFEDKNDGFFIIVRDALREISNCRYSFILVRRSLGKSILFLEQQLELSLLFREAVYLILQFPDSFLFRALELYLLSREEVYLILQLLDSFLQFVIFLFGPLELALPPRAQLCEIFLAALVALSQVFHFSLIILIISKQQTMIEE